LELIRPDGIHKATRTFQFMKLAQHCDQYDKEKHQEKTDWKSILKPWWN